MIKKIPFDKNGDLASYIFYRNKKDFNWIDDPGTWEDELEYVSCIVGNTPTYVFRSCKTNINYGMSFRHFMQLFEHNLFEYKDNSIFILGYFKIVQHGCSYNIEKIL